MLNRVCTPAAPKQHAPAAAKQHAPAAAKQHAPAAPKQQVRAEDVAAQGQPLEAGGAG
jgi:hypothetical protein